MVFYPSVEKIEEFNLLVLDVIKAKKSDQSRLASGAKLSAAINDCKQTEGGIFDKRDCTKARVCKREQENRFSRNEIFFDYE